MRPEALLRFKHQRAEQHDARRVGANPMRSTTTEVDNEVCPAWLEGGLRQTFENRQPQLWASLEAVMDEVLFELEVPPPAAARG